MRHLLDSTDTLREHVVTPLELGRSVQIAPSREESRALRPQPIPSGWIIDGDPVATALELTPGGQRDCTSGLWACTAGIFDWHFDADEVTRILDGSVRLSIEGRELTVTPGDVVCFRGGSTVRWEIDDYVEKFWVLGPSPTRGSRLRRRVRRGLRRLGAA